MPELKEALTSAYNQADAKHSCRHFVWHAIVKFWVLKSTRPAPP